jgi:hypothetical protein
MITYVSTYHLLTKINTLFVIVGRIQGRNASDALGTKASTRTVGAAPIERNAYDGTIIHADLTSIFDVGSLEERVDTRKMRKFSPGEGRNRLIF